jgi:guanylate kinase
MKTPNSDRTTPFDLPATPLLIVLSGPSGVGKDALLARMKQQDYPLSYVTTVTTRAKRTKERDSKDYYFVSVARFREMLDSNELLESANVYGNWYGVPRKPIQDALERGQDTIVKVDIQGAATIKKNVPEALLIFLMPPSLEELITRLNQRRTELPFDLALRIKTAEEEIQQLPLFDYVIISERDKLDLAVSDIEAIIIAEKHRVNPRKITL